MRLDKIRHKRNQSSFTPLEKVHPARNGISNGVKERSSLTGFTLIELLVATILILVVWGGSFQVFIYTMGLNNSNRNLTMAMQHLTTVMERMVTLNKENRETELFATFPADYCSTPNPPCANWVPVPRGIQNYTILGTARCGDINTETITYLYPNYVRGPSDPLMGPPNSSPVLLEVLLSVTWQERGRDMGPVVLRHYLAKEQ